ncbi:hypothetical protein AVEN_115102-1 [Araneus ventricosus]|uniref:Uncharacterized protein n=1 Tax=Araneus ventricosus TaxID=182803 RepID=A0A4Y1ZX72_ARAVE|nr:hypothetical protein AVEN_115102-1 [Araneus ventricosus]
MPVRGKIIGWVRAFQLNWLNIQFAQGQSDNLCHICVLIQQSAGVQTYIQTSCMLACSLVNHADDGKDCLLISRSEVLRQNRLSHVGGRPLACSPYTFRSLLNIYDHLQWAEMNEMAGCANK